MDSGIAWIVIFFFKNEKVNFISRIITIQLSTPGVVLGVCRDGIAAVEGPGMACGFRPKPALPDGPDLPSGLAVGRAGPRTEYPCPIQQQVWGPVGCRRWVPGVVAPAGFLGTSFRAV